MSWLSDFVKGGKNPADAAMPYLNQIAPMEKEYYEPYIQHGNEAYNIFNPKLQGMTNDPVAFLEQIMKGYEPSKAYQLRRDETQRAAGNSAAAGGMRGSINDITNQARLTDALLGNDMQQWLENVLGLQKQGTAGLEHIFDTGANASGALAGDLSNVLGTQAGLAFQGQANQNKSKSDLLSSLTQALGGILGINLPGKDAGTFGGKIVSRFF